MTATMNVVRVRIHIAEGQRRALITVLDRSPDERVRVSGFTVSFDMDDPREWLEARMAEWPRGEFPRASLHGVLRSLRSAIQGQVQPDLSASVEGQAQPDLETPSSEEAGMATFDESGERLDAWSDAEFFAATVEEARWLDSQHGPECGCRLCTGEETGS